MRIKTQQIRLRRLLLAKDVIMSLLAIVSLGLLALEHLEKLSGEQLNGVESFEIVVGLIFLVEFIVELYYAKNKRTYWRTHWFFLLAAIPLPFQSVDWLRGIRVLRLFRLMKIFTHLDYEHNTRMLEK